LTQTLSAAAAAADEEPAPCSKTLPVLDGRAPSPSPPPPAAAADVPAISKNRQTRVGHTQTPPAAAAAVRYGMTRRGSAGLSLAPSRGSSPAATAAAAASYAAGVAPGTTRRSSPAAAAAAAAGGSGGGVSPARSSRKACSSLGGAERSGDRLRRERGGSLGICGLQRRGSGAVQTDGRKST
jgi:hypothetical protein